jgi:hypothetical protein
MVSPDSEHDVELGATRHVPAILAFHKLLTSFSFGVSNYSPRRFCRLLSTLGHAGLRSRSVSDITSCADIYTYAVTFDDGYRHLLDVLPPLLERFELASMIFIPTAYLGLPNRWDYSHVFRNTPHLNHAEIRELSSLGVEFGSHGHSHCDLTKCSATDLAEELSRSGKTLEDILGKKVSAISYPFGRFNKRVIDKAGEMGYRIGFTMKFPSIHDTPLTAGRCPVYSFDSSLAIMNKLTGGRLKRLEAFKSRVVSSVSIGTDLLNRLRRNDSD